MPTIRLKRMLVRAFFVGLMGIDHLQLVYDPFDAGDRFQAHWMVVEGVRDTSTRGPVLGVQGAEGTLSLARANAASGAALTAKIGTPQDRDSRTLASGKTADALWPAIAEHAAAIAAQQWPYIAYSTPGSVLPTVNSSSVVATLLHHAQIDLADVLPGNARLLPGAETLLGTARDETLVAQRGFTTLMGGGGQDDLVADPAVAGPVKFYGGSGNDTCHWSPNVAVCNGGQPAMAGRDDGTDTMTFDKLSPAFVDSGPASDPTSLVVGGTRLFSIERLQWGSSSDHVKLAAAILASTRDLDLDLGGEENQGPGDILDLSQAATAVSANETVTGLRIETPASALTVTSVETLIATRHDDVVRAGAAIRGLYTGAGDDIVVISGATRNQIAGSTHDQTASSAHDQIVDVGSGADTLVLDLSQPMRQAATIDVVGGDADDRIRLLTSYSPCDGAPALTGQIPLEQAGAPIRVSYRRERDLLAMTVSDVRSGSTITVRIRDFRDGQWGIGAALYAPARSQDAEVDCGGSRAGVARRSMAKLASVPGWRSGGHDGARNVNASVSVSLRRRCRQRGGAGHGAHLLGPTALYPASRRNAYSRPHRRRRDDRVGRWKYGAPCRRLAANPPGVHQRGGCMATASRCPRGPLRTAAGPPCRTGLCLAIPA